MKPYKLGKQNEEWRETVKPVYEAPTIKTILEEEIVTALGPAHATTPAGSSYTP